MNIPRSFFAVRVPSSKPIDALLLRLGGLRGVKAVASENIHYTLRYLGDISQEDRDRLVHMLENASIDRKPFEVHIRGSGTFPAGGKPSVVWLGCHDEGAGSLSDLADKVDGFADEIGLGPRDKPFVPHLTLARIKRGESRSIEEVKAIVADNKDTEFGAVQVHKIQLVESRITDSGPIYTDIAEVPLE